MSSASRCSDSVVKPTRSRNRTETSRRSVDCVAGDRSEAASGTTVDSGAPHSPQNLAAGGLTVPQDGQARSNEEPHSMQNRRPASLVVPHAAQSKVIPSHGCAQPRANGSSGRAERCESQVALATT